MTRVVMLLLFATLVARPAAAAESTPAPDAVLYELTESMQLLVRGSTRAASAALSGTALVGTPLCPAELAHGAVASPASCNLTAIGRDTISLATGKGRFSAVIDVVVHGDNPVDGPELAVRQVGVNGHMDFSPAILAGIPYGTLKGKLTGKIVRTRETAFTGVFRLPFLGSNGVRAAICPLTPSPNPNFPPEQDYVYVDTTPAGTLTGRCIDIQPSELALGVPTVRFEIWF